MIGVIRNEISYLSATSEIFQMTMALSLGDVFIFKHTSILMLSVIIHFYWSLVQREEGISLVCEAIRSGIFNDLGSGSNVDVCVITKVGM